MSKNTSKTGFTTRSGNTTKYDAHHTVLSKTYGAQADLRRELADSKAAVSERTEILKIFADCADSQRAWLLLEDYFEKLSLSRKDFAGEDWWPRLMASQGKERLEETAFLFLRAHRPLPTELHAHANLARFAEIEAAEEENKLVHQLEQWLFPPSPAHLDSPRAALRVICEPVAVDGASCAPRFVRLLSCVPSAHRRENQNARRNHRTDHPRRARTGIVSLATIGNSSNGSPKPTRDPEGRGYTFILTGLGIAAMAGALG